MDQEDDINGGDVDPPFNPSQTIVKVEMELNENDDKVYVPPVISKKKKNRSLSRVRVKRELGEEIIEVEINPSEFDPFINELRLIKGLITEITCADDDDTVPRLKTEKDDFEDQNYMNDFVKDASEESEDSDSDMGHPLDDAFDDVPEMDFPVDIDNIKQELDPSLPAPKLSLHKLDPDLVDKYLNTSKGLLKARFLENMVEKQERAENPGDMDIPVGQFGIDSFVCHLCLNEYKTKKALSRHIREYHDRSALSKCDRCDYVAASAGALSAHVQVVHLKRYRYECPKCDDMKTQRKIHLIKHLISAHDVPEDQTAQLIKSRMRMKNREIGTTHSCKLCSYSSPSKSCLKKHVERKHGHDWEVPPERVCNLCREEFINVESKEIHPCPVKVKVKEILENVTANEDSKYECPDCSSAMFDSMEDLRDHYTKAHPPSVQEPKSVRRSRKVKIKAEVVEDDFAGTDAGDGSYLW